MIAKCPEMKCLPDGLQSLSTLKYLSIDKCPDLERRCKKDTGEDWPKISHITEIFIKGDWGELKTDGAIDWRDFCPRSLVNCFV